MNAIEIRDLTKRYGNLTAVNSLSLNIKQGEFFAMLGSNGAGKTTTIKMLSCLTEPTSGDALMLGNSLRKQADKVKDIINLSPQETAVAPKLTVKENLMMIARLHGSSKQEAREKADKIMETFELTDRKNDRAKQLSGGWQRKLSIAMALISNPKILFLDEPTIGLDVRARRELWGTMEKLKGKLTLILTTHYLEEAENAGYVVIMDSGKIAAQGTPVELKSKYVSDMLTIYHKGSTMADIERILKSKNMKYTFTKETVKIPVKSTFAALPIVNELKDYIFDFEVQKGKMDDLFVAVTGKEIK